MYETRPTVKIQANNRFGYRIINASAFDPSIHEIIGENHGLRQAETKAETAPASGSVIVSKGPRGMWYATIDGIRVAKGFPTELAARAAYEVKS